MSEDECLAFLYHYMPLPDSVDYSEDFWRTNIRSAILTREEMGWGVPEREWKHFVLPVRVNNENLDSSRQVFYRILKPRIEGLSMTDAILEINHWCHEQVTYQPSDGRTSSPLATLRNAIGRCGEESTFTVAALRAMGIPARQVYTPRWAHTDDNHAWVEAWADGQWYFFGACEPEPVLNLGWFNAPASRGMLMHTNVFGEYDGPENVINTNHCYTTIDVTANYAPTETFRVKTLDRDGKPVSAKVEFKLYNYAEFYTVARKESGDDGLTQFSAGLGDLLVWASDGTCFGFAKHSPGEEEVVVTLDKDSRFSGEFDIDVVPPVERNTVPQLSDDVVARNKIRLAYEDSLRLTKDTTNPDLQLFLDWAEDKPLAQTLIDVIADKDRKDVTVDVLQDHYLNVENDENVGNVENYNKYLLNPRISNEMLRPWRGALRDSLQAIVPSTSFELPSGSSSTPLQLVSWIRENITIDSESNPLRLCMSPMGVWRMRRCDAHSRDIFAVACARSLGIPSRINEITGKVEIPVGNVVSFDGENGENGENVGTSRLYLTCEENPSYYSHFSLSKINDGTMRLQEYPEVGCTYESTFRDGTDIERGQYALVSGTRLANGGVLVHLNIFVADSDKCIQPLLIRHDDKQIQVIGSFNSENLYHGIHAVLNGEVLELSEPKSILSTTGRGYYVLGLVRNNHEPSNHALKDVALKQAELNQTGRPVLILGADDNPALVAEIRENMHLESSELPLFIIADTFNRVVWVKQGYTIGLGEQLLSVLTSL